MKKTIFTLPFVVVLFTVLLMAFKSHQKTIQPLKKKKACAACDMYHTAQAPATSDISVAYNGSTIRISWSNSYGDHYTVGGYTGCCPFQYNCVSNYPDYADVPYGGAGNFRITAFCGACGSETSSSVSGAVPIY